MASSSSLLSEDEFRCSVCLDVFTDPVSTPCGHNFCMTCLNKHWDSTPHCPCPLCKEQFNIRPELRVNTFISGLAAEFRKTVQLKVSGPKEELAVKTVSCHVCTGEKLKAVKSCLDCGLSYCQTHLEPHKIEAKLKKHKLMDPVENLEDYICQKHERPLELFCRDDQTCVCQFCTETDHKTHNTVPLEEETEKRKSQLGKTHTEVQQMIQDKLKKIKEIRHSVQLSKTNTEQKMADSVEVFSSLIGCIERSRAELIELMKEKQKAAERQAEGFIKELEQEITELKRRDTELEQLSHSEDHLHLLQVYPTLCSPPHTTHSTDISIDPHLCVDTLRKTLEQLEKNFCEEVGRECEKEISTLSTVDVTLDPDTAHPCLVLSDDGKQVTCGDEEQNLPDNPERFDRCGNVLGKEGFSSGRFYYEVEVRGKTKWTLGVARESINRKGQIKGGPDAGYWSIRLRNGDEYKALDSPSVLLSLRQKPQKVGVFVDYEEGLVSFYDVEASSHIYSFTGQSFTEKLYPVFCPCMNDGGENSAPLVITPVR
ncbi:E3 ubiquitin-protein ligase TRIM39-like [Chanos chanos]|uniref:E3 ubiquitin-protein ligase TRIM39-like n=1 Tax=Chanos chanos TaxID=29144 RepID=A0A6J2VRW8_CHACN|nr:E3 ubiquitin-protein ligase TRIM39-like [Chanos chanos]